MAQHNEENWPDFPGQAEFRPDILEAWAPGQGIDCPTIVISRAGPHDPEPGIDHLDGGIRLGACEFDGGAADRLLSENGYRRVSPWSRGMGPQSDRHGLGVGNACEVEKVTEKALSAM